MTPAVPNHPDWRRKAEAARGYLALGLQEEAAGELTGILPHAAIDPEPMLLRLQVLRNLSRWEEMRALADELIVLQPRVSRWTIEKFWAVRYADGPAAACVWLDQAEEKFPLNGEVQMARACCLAQLGRLEEAFRRVDRALRLDDTLYSWLEEEADLEPLARDLAGPLSQP